MSRRAPSTYKSEEQSTQEHTHEHHKRRRPIFLHCVGIPRIIGCTIMKTHENSGGGTSAATSSTLTQRAENLKTVTKGRVRSIPEST